MTNKILGCKIKEIKKGGFIVDKSNILKSFLSSKVLKDQPDERDNLFGLNAFQKATETSKVKNFFNNMKDKMLSSILQPISEASSSNPKTQGDFLDLMKEYINNASIRHVINTSDGRANVSRLEKVATFNIPTDEDSLTYIRAINSNLSRLADQKVANQGRMETLENIGIYLSQLNKNSQHSANFFVKEGKLVFSQETFEPMTFASRSIKAKDVFSISKKGEAVFEGSSFDDNFAFISKSGHITINACAQKTFDNFNDTKVFVENPVKIDAQILDNRYDKNEPIENQIGIKDITIDKKPIVISQSQQIDDTNAYLTLARINGTSTITYITNQPVSHPHCTSSGDIYPIDEVQITDNYAISVARETHDNLNENLFSVESQNPTAFDSACYLAASLAGHDRPISINDNEKMSITTPENEINIKVEQATEVPQDEGMEQ